MTFIRITVYGELFVTPYKKGYRGEEVMLSAHENSIAADIIMVFVRSIYSHAKNVDAVLFLVTRVSLQR